MELTYLKLIAVSSTILRHILHQQTTQNVLKKIIDMVVCFLNKDIFV